MNAFGYEACDEPDATVDGYASDGVMRHASRIDGGTWSSKLGYYIRISHPRRVALEGETYGNIVAHYYREIRGFDRVYQAPAALPATSRRLLAARILDVRETFGKMAADFDTAFYNWQLSWLKPEKALVDASLTVTKGPEWDALINLGSGILPLVVGKLADKFNLYACALCEYNWQFSFRRHSWVP